MMYSNVHIAIEIIVVVFIIVFYKIMWSHVPARRWPSQEKRELTIIALNNAISGGLIAVSILLPISLVIGVTMFEKQVGPDILWQIKFASVYFLISIVAATWNLFRLPTMMRNEDDIAYDIRTVYTEILQLLFMLLGVERLTFAIWGM